MSYAACGRYPIRALAILIMITHRGRGLLGNRLFFMLSAIGHAHKVGTEAVFEDSTYFEWFANPPKLGPVPPLEVFEQPTHAYHEIPPKDNLELRGYYQCERYFDFCRDKVLWHFRPSEPIKQAVLKNHNRFEGCVAVHVRRGDYLWHQHMFQQLTPAYYLRGMEELGRDWEYKVFSNDPWWCYENLRFPGFNVEIMGTGPTELDFYFMTMCRHFIIANSTYSWMAAWLGEHPDKTVIAPEKWFMPECGNDDSDIIPKSWIKKPIGD